MFARLQATITEAVDEAFTPASGSSDGGSSSADEISESAAFPSAFGNEAKMFIQEREDGRRNAVHVLVLDGDDLWSSEPKMAALVALIKAAPEPEGGWDGKALRYKILSIF